MQDETTRIWRLLLQLAQATEAVLEREIPRNNGLPTHGLPILRLLRWHGPKTATAISAFLEVSIAQAQEALDEMVGVGFIRQTTSNNDEECDTYELAPGGLHAASQTILAQRSHIQHTIEQLSSEYRMAAGDFLDSLVSGLVSDSESFGIDCAECWAFDVRECVKSGTARSCAFRKAHCANLDPDPDEGPDDCPRWNADGTEQLVGIAVRPNKDA